jgi:hypothetical protein
MIRKLCTVPIVAGCGETPPVATSDRSARTCDEWPTGVEITDHALPFTVPAGLMPDPRFDGQAAEIAVHRVRPVYKHGKCPSVEARAIVLVHGRTAPGPPIFDLRHVEEPGEAPRGRLSVQEALARAGIDTFAPSLLGYGRSTRFTMDDPCNASLADCATGAVPCDRTHNPIFVRN